MEIRKHNKTKWKVYVKRAQWGESDNIDEIIAWCTANYGKPGKTKTEAAWKIGHTNLHHTFTFKNEPDMVMFSIRWG